MFHARCSRFTNDDIANLVNNALQSKVLAKIRNKLPYFFLIPGHTGDLSQEMKIVPYLTGADV